MRILWSLGRVFSKPATLWCLFSLVLLLTAGGLALLSRHALRLSQQQQASQQREQTQQNIRVALWRLDSRLGPYIATLHDTDLTENPFDSVADDFVIQRFMIARSDVPPSGGFRMSPATDVADLIAAGGAPADPSGENAIAANGNWQRLVNSIPVDSVVSAIDELIPEAEIGQSMWQSYGNQTMEFDPLSQRELASRGAAVQQQVAINAMYGSGKGGKTKGGGKSVEASGDDSNGNRLMSVWIDEHLVVVRAGRTANGQLEGVWIDWPALRESLLDDIRDLVPAADLRSVKQSDTIDPSRALAALPAMVVVPDTVITAAIWSPTHTALLLAWCSLIIAAIIAAAALSRLIALSERRASFVSAVTHELRTPLTTFRLYSDLLARDMVSDPSDRKEYLVTLRREADRLTHLVDNVLRYSKLQQTSKRAALETVTLSEWVERIAPRLQTRLAAADMTLVIDQRVDGRWMTDPPAMEQAVFNLVDNAAKYAASATDRRVHFTIDVHRGTVVLTITDHGDGVPESLRSSIFRPFTKTAERAAETAAGVGLGLALARQTAIALGGSLCYQAADDGGASFRLTIPQGVRD